MAPKVYLQKVVIRGGYAEERLKFFNKEFKSREVEIVSVTEDHNSKTIIIVNLLDGCADSKGTVELRVVQKKKEKDYYDDDDEDEEDDYDDEDEEDDYDDEDDEEEPPKTRKSPRVSGVLTKDTSRGR